MTLEDIRAFSENLTEKEKEQAQKEAEDSRAMWLPLALEDAGNGVANQTQAQMLAEELEVYQAREEGFAIAEEGCSGVGLNPYPKHSRVHDAWTEGNERGRLLTEMVEAVETYVKREKGAGMIDIAWFIDVLGYDPRAKEKD